MLFAQKIYIANKPLILTNDAASYIKEHPIAGGYAQFLGAFPRHYRLAFQHLSRPRALGALIQDLSPDALKSEMHHLYTPIDAAGGVVRNEQGHVLMIYRRGKWDLPKGKVDDDEDIATCALREVQEETGLQKVTIGNIICETYHTYSQQGQSLLKRTTWYNMTGKSTDTLVPQASENIEEARWISETDLSHYVYKSYDAIREVLSAAGLKW